MSENPTENQRKLAPRAASFADPLAAIGASAPRGFVIAPLSQSVRSLSPNVRQPEWLLSRNLSQRMPLLSRRANELIEPLHLDTSSAMGRFFLTVMAGAAELERNLIAERTTEAMSYKKTQDERISRHIPYGKMLADDGMHLIDHPDEQAVIAIARDLHNAGLSSRKIATRLAEQGMLSRVGTVFTSSAILAMVA